VRGEALGEDSPASVEAHAVSARRDRAATPAVVARRAEREKDIGYQGPSRARLSVNGESGIAPGGAS